MGRPRHDYSSTQCDLPPSLANRVVKWGKDYLEDIDLYKDPDAPNDGRETEPHVTVLYGIYETDAQKVRYAISGENPFEVVLGEIGFFTNENFDVVKVNVECEKLYDLNATLKEKFTYRKTFPAYSPHVTIAYVKKGRGKIFDGDKTFVGETFTVKQIVFSPKDGGKCLISLRGRSS